MSSHGSGYSVCFALLQQVVLDCRYCDTYVTDVVFVRHEVQTDIDSDIEVDDEGVEYDCDIAVDSLSSSVGDR